MDLNEFIKSLEPDEHGIGKYMTTCDVKQMCWRLRNRIIQNEKLIAILIKYHENSIKALKSF